MSASTSTSQLRSDPPASPRSDGAAGRRGGSLLARPLLRAVLLLPAVAIVVYGAVTDQIVDPALFVGLTVVVVALVGLGALGPWGPVTVIVPRSASASELAWQGVVLALGVGLVPVTLNLGLEADVQVAAAVFVLLLVIGVYTFPPGLRPWLLGWTLAMWLVTLWRGGVTATELLALHLAGGLAAIVVTLRSARALTRSLAGEAAQRQDAERWARLLAGVARTNSLDPDQVLRGTVEGLVEVGFTLAAVRVVDLERRVVRLVEGAASVDVSLAEEVDLDDGEFATVVETGAPRRVPDEWYDLGGRGGPVPEDLLYLPLFDGKRVHATVSAGTLDGPITDTMVAAAELLAEQASAALTRARAHRQDQRTVDQLRRLDERTQDFVSTVSHELRTPLTVVQGLGQTLLDRWHDLTAEQRRDLLDRIEANADRLGAMVRSLLDTSAMESGTLQLSPEAVALPATIEGLLHRLTGALEDHPVDVEVASGLVVEVDRGLFEHVLENLLNNAVKHTPPGTRITVSARRQHARAIVSVRDDGPGIGSEDLPYVLDRFYRGGTPMRREAGGLGLGLALAREVVEAHGGQLGVVSRLDEGTVFSFDVPLAG
ncbi:MAG: sensor histidine kinase [Nitriliruptoraceae bacterium]